MQAKARDRKLAGLEKLGRQNTSVGQWSSPGLNMSHGFMKKIQQMEMEQRRQLALKNAARANEELQAVSPQRSTKPTMQIYRPPAARLAEMERQQQSSPPSTDDVNRRPTNGDTSTCGPVPDPKPGLNHCEGFSPAPQESSKVRQEPDAPKCSSELDVSYDDGKSCILANDSIVQEVLHAARLAEMERQQQSSPPSTDDVNRRPMNGGTSACGPMPDPKPGSNHCEDFSPAPQESPKARQEPEAPTCSSELDVSYDDGEGGILANDSIVQEALHAARLAEMERQQSSPPSTDDVNRRPTNGDTAACGPMPDPNPGPNHCEGFSPAPQESSKARQEPEAPTCSSELDFSYDDGECGILANDSIVQEALHASIDESVSDDDGDEFLCGICKKSFRTRKFCQHHVWSHLNPADSAKLFKCPTCVKAFSTSWAQKYHYKMKHVGARHKCSQCDATFESDVALSLHHRCTH